MLKIKCLKEDEDIMQPATTHSSYIIDKLSAAMQEALQFNHPSLSLLTIAKWCLLHVRHSLEGFGFLASLSVPLHLHLHGSRIVIISSISSVTSQELFTKWLMEFSILLIKD